ncbi:MAG: TldD/PmbA family protein [Planctomycetia bacterium]|nr:MAG: TldD/PmbA family protein [Planctomycetia bacterium]
MARRWYTRRDFVRVLSASAAGTWLIGCQSPQRSERGPSAQTPPAPDDDLPVGNDWDTLSEVALLRIRRAGCEYGDIRIIESGVQSIRGQDRRIAAISDRRSSGLGVRVLCNGAWGFAASAVTTAAEARHVADLAIEVARGSALLSTERIRLAEEPVSRAEYATAYEIDPFNVPLAERTRLLLDLMERVQGVPGIARSSASLWAARDVKYFASTEGTRLRLNLLAVHGGFSATALADGRFASRSFSVPYLRTGYEHVRDGGLLESAQRIAEEAVEKVSAPAVEPGRYDLLLDPQHLSLTIHESCGHATELDRALGHEANYAGTSFLTPEKLNTFRYGSRHVTLIADNTEEGTLAATGFDDEGVAGQQWPIVEEGRFVGFSTSREFAAAAGESRSRGSCRADSWSSIPIVRIPNIGLAPGNGRLDDMIADIRRGILIEGHGSFSIDQKRYNFQFGGDAFWLIEHGRRSHMLRDVIYTDITPEFWNRCDAVADASHRQRWGFINCGKGQPGQSGWMSHPAAHARFRDVAVIRGSTAG